MDWLERVAELAQNYEALINLLAFIGGAIITGGLGWRWFRWLMAERDRLKAKVAELASQRDHLLQEYQRTVNAHQRLQQVIDRARGCFTSGDRSLWSRQPVGFPDNYHAAMNASKPIVVVANLKGGVGKTTIAANLAAYFEQRHGERVLAIDLDYQGSLSSMLMPGTAYRDFGASTPTRQGLEEIIEGSARPEVVFQSSYPIQDTQRDSRVLPCRAYFADKEQSIMINWLLQEAADGDDIRYNLARILLSDAIQAQFDRIVIDTPPRVTTGFINALCAGTYMLIPFQLDVLSAERVGLFLQDIRRLKPSLFPGLGSIDIVGTMKATATGHLQNAEQEALGRVRQDAATAWGVGVRAQLLEMMIPRRASIAQNAGIGIAYEVNRDIFDPLGEAVFRHSTSEVALP